MLDNSYCHTCKAIIERLSLIIGRALLFSKLVCQNIQITFILPFKNQRNLRQISDERAMKIVDHTSSIASNELRCLA